MDLLRTPDDRFIDLLSYDFASSYGDEPRVHESLRVHYLEQGLGGANLTYLCLPEKPT